MVLNHILPAQETFVFLQGIVPTFTHAYDLMKSEQSLYYIQQVEFTNAITHAILLIHLTFVSVYHK